MPDQTEITITRNQSGAVFPTVGITQSQLVFWQNEDPQGQPHWPLFPNGLQPRTQVGAGDTSDPLQPASGVATFPTLTQCQVFPTSYTCQIKGHQSEQGVVNVVLDFFSNPNQLPDATVNVAYTPFALTQGGMPPFTYKLSDESLPT